MKIIIKIIPFIILILLLLLPILVRNGLTEEINLKGKTFKIATGADGGIYKPLGQGLATLLNREMPSGNFEVITTGGSVENLKLLSVNTGDEKSIDIKFADLAFLQGDIALSAYKGEIGLPESSHLRGILALYKEFFQIYVRYDSGIEKFEDILGKVVAIGDYGSSMSHNAKIFCEAANIDFDKLDKRYMPFVSALHQLENKYVDVVFFFGGGKLKDVESKGFLKNSDFSDSSTKRFLKLLPLSHQTIENLKASKLSYIPITITQDDYTFLENNVDTVGHVAILVCKESLPDALAGEIYRIILENTEQLSMSHPIAREIKQVNQKLIPLPLHKGVKEYSGEHIEYFVLTIMILLSVILFTFFISMRIIYSGSFSRFLIALFKTSQGKGYIISFSIIFFFMGFVLLVGSALITEAEISSNETHYTNFQSSLQSILKAIITGFDRNNMPSTFFGNATIYSIFITYLMLIILLTVNIVVLIARPYQQCAPAKITAKIKDDSGQSNANSISQTKDFSKD